MLNGSPLFKPAWARRILDVLIEAASRRDRLPWWSGIGIGALAAGVAALGRLALLGETTTRLAYVTFYPVVVVASLVGGLSTGISAAVLCAFTVHYFFVPLVDATDVAGLAGFSLSCALIIGVTEMLRRAWARVVEVERRESSMSGFRRLSHPRPTRLSARVSTGSSPVGTPGRRACSALASKR
jgi:hypothetical protein